MGSTSYDKQSQTSQKQKLTILLFQPRCVKGRLLLLTINIALINK